MQEISRETNTMAGFILQLLFFIFSHSIIQHGSSQEITSASVSNTWKNNISSTDLGTWNFSDGSILRPIFAIYSYRQPNYTFGFFKINASHSDSQFYLSILKHPYSSNSSFNFTNYSPVVLWCANRNRPVGENSSLEFTVDGNLVLTDRDDSLVWSTNTSGLSVVRMTLLYGGNLRLFNASNAAQWQSFDYPTDTWAPNQLLRYGQRLTSSVSDFNLSSGFFHLSVTENGIYGFNESNLENSYATLFAYNGGPATFNFGIGYLSQLKTYAKYEPYGKDFQFIRLQPDGHLYVYQLVDGYKNTFVSDLFSNDSLGWKESQKKSDSSLVIKIVIPLSAILLVVLLVSGTRLVFAWRKRKVAEQTTGEEVTTQVQDVLINFPYQDLRSATRNFKPSLKLGRGAYGKVFLATLNGIMIAVKRLRSGACEGRSDFKAEVQTLGRIHHVNLVKLIGYCITGSERLLIYEYMCNGSLHKWIFHREEGKALPWNIRRNIIADIAKGLSYLHESCSPSIIHLDIKPDNILLDENFKAKITDFGLARFLEKDQSQVLTTCKGTPCYIAPELWTANKITAKADIYSFGIVILEIVSGLEIPSLHGEEFLVDILKRKAEDCRLFDMVEKQSIMQSDIEEAVRMLEIAIRCLQPYKVRPSISMVVKFIEGSKPMKAINDYNFLTIQQYEAGNTSPTASMPLLADILSGPRS